MVKVMSTVVNMQVNELRRRAELRASKGTAEASPLSMAVLLSIFCAIVLTNQVYAEFGCFANLNLQICFS